MSEPIKTDTVFATRPASRRDALVQWGIMAGFWLLIFIAAMLGAFLFSPNSVAYSWRPAAIQWLPWIVLTPIIMWLSSAFTLERSTWRRNIWVHLAACAVIVGSLGVLWYAEFLRPFAAPPPPPQFSAPGPRMYPPGRGPANGGDGFQPAGPVPYFSVSNNAPGPRMGWPGPRPDAETPEGTNWPGPGPGWNAGSPRWGDASWFNGRPDPQSYVPGRNFQMWMPFGWQPSTALVIMGAATLQLPTFWAVLGAAHALLFYKRAKDRERRGVELESRLTQARLKALRAQLNPHFLFNTLNSIASLVYEQPKVADEMIGSLSDLLRLTLNTPDRQEVTLREELHFLDQYLYIEQTRFGERLKIEKKIEPATLEAVAPILILQPLVENAFKHGIESQLGPGVVTIAARRIGQTLHLEVTDNGRGLAGTPEGKLTEGVGLGNTRARLRELYGANGLLSYGARQEGGFWVDVQIPWQTTPSFKVAPKTQAG